LHLITAGNAVYTAGEGAPYVTVRLHRRMPGLAFALRPDLKMIAAYREGTLTVEQGSLGDFFYILSVNYRRARKCFFFETLELLNGSVSKSHLSHSDLMKSLYGFLPETKLRHVLLDKKWPKATHFLFAKPWHKLFHVRKAWGGLRLPAASDLHSGLFRKSLIHQGPATNVSLSMSLYRSDRQRPRAETCGMAQGFKIHNGRAGTGIIVAIKTKQKHYTSALKNTALPVKQAQISGMPFDQYFYGKKHFMLVHSEPTFDYRAVKPAHIHLGERKEIMPWTRETMSMWEHTHCAQSDNFVRQETS
jgi:hypothetical protein